MDVAPKTPNKRKSLGLKNNSAKKVKVENGQTPKYHTRSVTIQKGQSSPKQQTKLDTPKRNQQTPEKNKTPKQQVKTPKQEISVKHRQKKQQTAKQQVVASNMACKKAEQVPVEGTSQVKKKKRRQAYASILVKIKSGDTAEAIKIINEKFKIIERRILESIERREEITKTSVRKLALLQRYKQIAKSLTPPAPSVKSEPTQGTAKMKKAAARKQTKQQKGKVQKIVKKEPGDSDDEEENAVSKVKVQRVVKNEPEDDSDDEEENELSKAKVREIVSEEPEDDSGEEEESSDEDDDQDNNGDDESGEGCD